jgi:xylulokinase
MGIDLGTSSAKVILLDPKGKVRALSSQDYPILSPKPGWAEQNPQDWIGSVRKAIFTAVQKVDPSGESIQAIGLSGQMHGTICLDRSNEVIRLAMIWADQRSEKQVKHVQDHIGIENLGRWTANPIAVGFMLSSLLWLRENEPDEFGKISHILLPKDYVRFCLTGEIGCEPSDASSTSLFDTIHRCWSGEMMQALEINPLLFPKVHPSTEIAGNLVSSFAKTAGLKPGIPVIFGGADQACQALGNGIIKPGLVSCTIGTGGQILAPTTAADYDPQLRLQFYCHVDPSLWYWEAAILSAGLSLKWLKETLFKELSFSDMADFALQAPPGSEGLFFLPYLAGERTPLMDPRARGGFIGITLRHKEAHIIRAVMEGVVFSLRQGLDLMVERGVRVEKLVATGGGAYHPLWLQLLADIFNLPIHRSAREESSAVGAALLGGIGVHIFKDFRETLGLYSDHEEEVFVPDLKNVEFYARQYQIFRDLYPSLKVAGYEEA